jgi:hypothetical protein
MDPTIKNLFELIKQNCTRHKCSSFVGYEKICKTYADCNILRSKLIEWNLFLFPERPCNECLVRTTCIERRLIIEAGFCEQFEQYKGELIKKYIYAESLLYPELLKYYDWPLDLPDEDDGSSYIEAYYPRYINMPYTPKGILTF